MTFTGTSRAGLGCIIPKILRLQEHPPGMSHESERKSRAATSGLAKE